jgi:hypothetical protein
MFKEPRNRVQGIDSAILFSPASVRLLGLSHRPGRLESVPGLLKRFTNSGSAHNNFANSVELPTQYYLSYAAP